MQLQALNFPSTYDFKIRKDKDKFFIYDPTRRTYLLLSPEEWVRQHWIHYLIQDKGYALSALLCEKKIVLGRVTKRLDILVSRKLTTELLIECKAPHISLSQSTFEQIARYNSVVNAQGLLLSNGLEHIFATQTKEGYQFSRYEF